MENLCCRTLRERNGLLRSGESQVTTTPHKHIPVSLSLDEATLLASSSGVDMEYTDVCCCCSRGWEAEEEPTVPRRRSRESA
jgi:hypothetical protein